MNPHKIQYHPVDRSHELQIIQIIFPPVTKTIYILSIQKINYEWNPFPKRNKSLSENFIPI